MGGNGGIVKVDILRFHTPVTLNTIILQIMLRIEFPLPPDAMYFTKEIGSCFILGVNIPHVSNQAIKIINVFDVYT